MEDSEPASSPGARDGLGSTGRAAREPPESQKRRCTAATATEDVPSSSRAGACPPAGGDGYGAGEGDGRAQAGRRKSRIRRRSTQHFRLRLRHQQPAEGALQQWPELARKLGAARWVVHVSSTAPDGTENLRCSGICIHWSKEEQRARILTSYRVAFCTSKNGRANDPAPKLAVHLPNMDVLEARLLFFDENYEFALLEISVSSSFEVELPVCGCSPRYGQEVFTLARDTDLSFKLGQRTIVWLEEGPFLFLDRKLIQCGIGGAVINHNGNVIGMSSDDDSQNPPIVSITTILTCVEMLTTFSRIACPMLGMCLRRVELLDIVRMDELQYKYGIRNGFVVKQVIEDSDAEKLGIRRGDVIVSFNGISSCYLPQFEDFLLSIGLDSLRGMRTVNDFKLEVYNLLQKVKRTITLPVQFCYAS